MYGTLHSKTSTIKVNNWPLWQRFTSVTDAHSDFDYTICITQCFNAPSHQRVVSQFSVLNAFGCRCKQVHTFPAHSFHLRSRLQQLLWHRVRHPSQRRDCCIFAVLCGMRKYYCHWHQAHCQWRPYSQIRLSESRRRK
jgi:hypothetical protein